MSGLTLDAASSERLRTIREPIRLYDDQGLPLGTFTPAVNEQTTEAGEVPYSDEEIRLLKTQRGGRELDAILADLEGQG